MIVRLGNVRLSLVSLAIFFKNRHGYFYKTYIFHESGMEVVSIQENFRCSSIETFSESGGLPS